MLLQYIIGIHIRGLEYQVTMSNVTMFKLCLNLHRVNRLGNLPLELNVPLTLNVLLQRRSY